MARFKIVAKAEVAYIYKVEAANEDEALKKWEDMDLSMGKLDEGHYCGCNPEEFESIEEVD